MKRTTVFLPEDVHDRLRREAFEAHVSMAHLIRRRLEGRGRSGRPQAAADPLAKMEGIVRDGHLSEGIDEGLYSPE